MVNLITETREQQERRMAWWREAKFGMYVRRIGEWIQQRAMMPVKEYEELAKRFNPVKFNAKEWVQIAKGAEMKWIIITAKHHDGFCMFETKLADYNILKATPFKRDPLKKKYVRGQFKM